ncbi:MAG: LysM peptidoglycan-binding domain-containing protein [Akkermansiaceae bacterium]
MNFVPSPIYFGIGACVLLSSCGENQSNPDYNPAIGPFDENGNYVEAWADNPPKSRKSRKTTSKPPWKTASRPKPQPQATAQTTRSLSRPQPQPQATPRPKPRVQAKPQPKPVKVAPRGIRHRVKKGDTLYGLARKYGTTVSRIQKANRLRGTIIRTGSTLLIPR